MKKIQIVLVLLGLQWSLEITAQKYEFYKEISGYGNDPKYFQYSSGLAKITVDPFDNMYILDLNGNAVIKLDNNKNFVKKWYSSDYNEDMEVKKQNSDGIWGAMFDFVKGIKTDFKGNVYVFGFGKIHKFDSNGKFLKTISNVGEFEDISFDSLGNIYAITQETIEKLNPNGEHIGNLFPNIKDENETHIMNSIALDNKNNVYVLDRGLGKILKFNDKSEYVESFCKRGEGDGEILDAEGLAIDKNNNIYISDNTNWRIQCLDDKGRFKYKIGRDSSTIDKIIYPHAVALDSKGHIYVQSLYNGIVEYDLNKKYVATWGTDGNQDGCLVAPNGIYISNDDFIYIVDEKKPTIQKFNLEGKFIELFLKTNDLNGSPYRVLDICEDDANNIVLLTQRPETPLVFVDRKGYYHMKYTSQNKEHLQGKSFGIKKDNKNDYSENYYINSFRYIKKINSNGSLILKFTSIDTTTRNLTVSDFILDNDGNVIVGFSGHSIQKFDKNGKFLNYIVKYDSSVAINRNFQSIAMDKKGYVYTLNNDCEILVFNNFGSLVTKVSLNGKMTPCLNTSEKITVTEDGEKIYVTDKINYRVQIFKKSN